MACSCAISARATPRGSATRWGAPTTSTWTIPSIGSTASSPRASTTEALPRPGEHDGFELERRRRGGDVQQRGSEHVFRGILGIEPHPDFLSARQLPEALLLLARLGQMGPPLLPRGGGRVVARGHLREGRLGLHREHV